MDETQQRYARATRAKRLLFFLFESKQNEHPLLLVCTCPLPRSSLVERPRPVERLVELQKRNDARVLVVGEPGALPTCVTPSVWRQSEHFADDALAVVSVVACEVRGILDDVRVPLLAVEEDEEIIEHTVGGKSRVHVLFHFNHFSVLCPRRTLFLQIDLKTFVDYGQKNE